jgi:hypothetical protein
MTFAYLTGMTDAIRAFVTTAEESLGHFQKDKSQHDEEAKLKQYAMRIQRGIYPRICESTLQERGFNVHCKGDGTTLFLSGPGVDQGFVLFFTHSQTTIETLQEIGFTQVILSINGFNETFNIPTTQIPAQVTSKPAKKDYLQLCEEAWQAAEPSLREYRRGLRDAWNKAGLEPPCDPPDGKKINLETQRVERSTEH